ncbi:hypothetical protein N7468_006600 [Penicillium chermesinum]|uniref:TLDc domain-containing protein n=1 Tax=Penicillium chermesinum TaxID=63820 RepID=A0A9W9NSJ5_9EURO|nr:uncharacterized protein N7468_006600 [Penicillium chermesinum]KAJ5225375.1 hypothetical protein N7468_006600 [Penicillium chermesinum]
MGAGQSTEYSGATPEELSYVLAERFATKCFTPLELTHFKDNFFSRAAEQGGLRYWNEKTLSDFLGVPDGSFSTSQETPLDAGPVLFRMVSYLGAFPFQNTLAPSVLTFEAMVKVVVLLTERYGKVLKRGRKDLEKEEKGAPADDQAGSSTIQSHAPGFSVDEPANDDYDEDEDDDLALAALESLDAIEVFKQDHRVDKTVYETRISTDTFRRLLMLLLVLAPLKPLEPVKMYTSNLDPQQLTEIQKEADSIIRAFDPEDSDGGISYRAFARTVSSSLPFLFDPLTALFEHLLFSKNLDLSQRRQKGVLPEEETSEKPEDIPAPAPVTLQGSFESTVLNPALISHLSFFLASISPTVNLFRSGARLHPVFSTAAHGSSLTSFSHNVLTWQSATLLILQGTPEGTEGTEDNLVTLGAYLPQPWKSPSSTSTSSTTNQHIDPLPCLFQLSPQHKVLQGNPSPSIIKQLNTPAAWFSTHELHIAPVGHDGVFLPSGTSSLADKPTKTRLDLYNLEVWGIIPDPEQATSSGSGQSAVEAQHAKWEFEAREAERRRNVNLKSGAGDIEGARWLLETAGIIGDHGQHGGSV